MKRWRLRLGAALAMGNLASCSLLLDDGLTGGSNGGAADSGGSEVSTEGAARSDASSQSTDAGGDACDASSPNCGTCSTCEGTCTEGICDPRVEAEVPGLSGLAATPTSVAWSTPSKVSLKLADGGTKDFTMSASVGADIAYGSGGILAGSNSGSAGSAYICRPESTCQRIQSNITPIAAVAGEATTLHMLAKGGDVFTCITVSDCNSASRALPKAEGPFMDFAVLGGRLFWVTGAALGKVRSAPRSTVLLADGGYGDLGSPITELAVDVPAPRGITTDALGVVWTESGSGRIRRCAVTSDGTCVSAPTTVFEGTAQDAPTRIVSDGDNVYWIGETARRVYRCPASGCVGAPAVVMRGLADPKRIALSLDRVYVADYGTSRVLSAPK